MAMKRDNVVEVSGDSTEASVWVHLSPKGWLACSWEWNEPLNEALKDGTLNLKLSHDSQNAQGKWKKTWGAPWYLSEGTCKKAFRTLRKRIPYTYAESDRTHM